ncbi:MAG: hypothetical protein AAFX87_28480 [Bacteroidota bacterium]
MTHSKSFILIILASITAVSIAHTYASNDWLRFGLKGKVKSYSQRTYKAVKTSDELVIGDAEDIGNDNVSFDAAGRYLGTDAMDSQNKLARRITPTYEEGKVVKEDHFSPDGELLMTSNIHRINETEYTFESFDSKGDRLLTINSAYGGQRITKQYVDDHQRGYDINVHFEYNEDAHMTSMRHTNLEGNLVFSETYEYIAKDSRGNWTKRLVYRLKGKEPRSIQVRKYEYY